MFAVGMFAVDMLAAVDMFVAVDMFAAVDSPAAGNPVAAHILAVASDGCIVGHSHRPAVSWVGWVRQASECLDSAWVAGTPELEMSIEFQSYKALSSWYPSLP